MTENMKQQSNRPCDVLIIGGGSAGLRAAIEAHNAGAHVLIIAKSKKGYPGRANWRNNDKSSFLIIVADCPYFM